MFALINTWPAQSTLSAPLSPAAGGVEPGGRNESSPLGALTKVATGRYFSGGRTTTVLLHTDGRPEQRRLVLETIEESYGTKVPVDLSALTIEHIMPQTLTEEWVTELGEFAQERHREMVHRIGKLTLTGYNPELSNSPFHVKRKKLAESNVAMNKEIAREEEWGFAQIEERGRRLAERALALWPGPTSSSGAAF